MTLAGYEQSQGIPVDPLFDTPQSETDSTAADGVIHDESTSQPYTDKPDTNIDSPSVRTVTTQQNVAVETTSQADAADVQETQEPEPEQFAFTDSIDREAIAAFINKTALITYEIKPFKTTDYLPSLIQLASLIKNTGLDAYALHSIQQDGVKMIEEYIGKLKASGEYDVLASEVKKLNL